MNAITDKYFSRAVAANVTFGRGPHEFFNCDIVSPVAPGIVLKASNNAGDAHVAFEGAAAKIERQLKRYMGRLRERRAEAEPQIDENAAYTVFAATGDEDSAPPESPAIVAETRVDIPDASVSDAQASPPTFTAKLYNVDGKRVAAGRDFDSLGQLKKPNEVLVLDEAGARALATGRARRAT